MSKHLGIVKLALACFSSGLLVWLLYGIIWEIWYDLTTPPITVVNGYIAEHTIGEYIVIAAVLGIIFASVSTIISIAGAYLYVTLRHGVKHIMEYSFTKRCFVLFTLLSVLICLTPVLILVWYS